MSDLDLAGLRRIAEAATPGPWVVDYRGVTITQHTGTAVEPLIACSLGSEATSEDRANFPHIAAFDPPTVLALLDRIEALEAVAMTLWDSPIIARKKEKKP